MQITFPHYVTLVIDVINKHETSIPLAFTYKLKPRYRAACNNSQVLHENGLEAPHIIKSTISLLHVKYNIYEGLCYFILHACSPYNNITLPYDAAGR